MSLNISLFNIMKQTLLIHSYIQESQFTLLQD